MIDFFLRFFLAGDVVMIDLDYRCHDIFKFSYKGTKPKKDPRCQV
jgi:hypothetical protein